MKLKYFLIVLRQNALNIAIALVVAALIIMIALVSWLSMTSPEAVEIQRRQQEYLKKLDQEYNTTAGQRAWKRLHRKHGHPDKVVYELGKTPWYINKDGKKCRFI